MISTRRTHTKEFKESTVELLLSSKKTAVEVSQDLGIRPELIYRWKREYLKDKDRAFPGSGQQNLSESEQELKRLRRDNMELEEERDILKFTRRNLNVDGKALAIFSKRSR